MDDGGVLRSKNKSKAERPVVASSSSNEHRWKYFLRAKLACDSVHKWDPRFRLIPKIGQNWFNGCRIGCYMLLWSVLSTNLPWRQLCQIIQWQWSKYLFIYSISVNVKKFKTHVSCEIFNGFWIFQKYPELTFLLDISCVNFRLPCF